MRVGDGELHQGRSREGRHQGDADARRLQHAHHEPPRRLPVRRDPARPAERRAADARQRPERLAVVGRDALLVHPAAEAGDAGGGADRSADGRDPHDAGSCRRRSARGRRSQTIINEQSWFIWLPIVDDQVPVSNRFGNMQPSVMAHRILWNIERVFVKPRATADTPPCAPTSCGGCCRRFRCCSASRC